MQFKAPATTILVIDGEPRRRQRLSAVLAGGGFQVLEAAGADEALARIREERPHLILADLPRASASDILSVVRSVSALAEPPAALPSRESLREPAAVLARKLLECALDAIVIVDPKGSMVLVNSPTERLFGYSREELVGKAFESLLVERDRSHNPALEAASSAGPACRQRQVFCRRRDGTEFPAEVTFSPLETEEGLMVTATIRDITERQRAAAELQRAREAAKAVGGSHSDRLVKMSQEICRPLKGMIGMTELALDSELSAEQRCQLETAKISADSLLTVINDILDLSKIEAGCLELESIPFSLRENLASTIKALAPRIPWESVELALQIPPEVPDTLAGDPTRLRQIVTNLVGNAIKFTARGEVLLRVEKARPAFAGHGSDAAGAICLHFVVKDTGIGIPGEKLDAVFRAFGQADEFVTSQYGGAGLGLSISRQIVELMGGRIWIESAVGRGSNVHFTARFAAAAASATRPAPSRRPDLDGLAALVADDNATNRDILGQMLRSWNMRPVLAENGPAALALMEKAAAAGKPFPLVILDAQMPEMDGFEAAYLLRESPGAAAAQIMMLTAAGLRGDAGRCRELGVSAYLTKPITAAELWDAIVQVLGPERAGRHAELVTRHSIREARHRLHILLAEDNRVNQDLTARLLRKQGHTVVVVGDGRAALEALDRERFDLVLMDVQMPVMSGMEAVAAIREKEKGGGRRIPIVALTVNARKPDRESCLDVGMDFCVAKPINAQELFEAIEGLAV